MIPISNCLRRPVVLALQNKKSIGTAADEKVSIVHMKRLCGTENDEVRNYVLTKPLHRPKTNALTMILIALICFGVGALVSFTVIRITPLALPQRVIIAVVCDACILLCFSKFILIKAVECYQHYANEETRRRCLCMPTCSEYAIAVLKKYNLFVALRKIRTRLFVTCSGVLYLKDLP